MTDDLAAQDFPRRLAKVENTLTGLRAEVHGIVESVTSLKLSLDKVVDGLKVRIGPILGLAIAAVGVLITIGTLTFWPVWRDIDRLQTDVASVNAARLAEAREWGALEERVASLKETRAEDREDMLLLFAAADTRLERRITDLRREIETRTTDRFQRPEAEARLDALTADIARLRTELE